EAHAAAALRALGVDPHALPESELDALAARLEVVETYRPLFARLVDIVRRAGVIEDHDPTDALIAACPSAEAELRLLDRCAEALPDVVRGRRDPLEVLFPSDDSTSAAHLYGEARAAVVMTRLLEQLVHLLAREAAVPLRLLEIGAGTGGTTAAILAALGDKGAAEYVFTDISPAFFDRAKARFAHVPYLRTARLDISAPPEDQRLGPHHDVVIAANVLHATPDLGRALDH